MGCDRLSGILVREMQGGCCARIVHFYGNVTYSCAGMFTHLGTGPKILMANSLLVMNSVLHTVVNAHILLVIMQFMNVTEC